MPLWLAGEPLVLASRSEARRALLEAAGVPIEIVPADLDETALIRTAAARDPRGIALMLAREKARAVAARKPHRLIVGADQTLALGGQLLSKPASKLEAAAQLRSLRGQAHVLHTAVAVIRDGKVAFEHSETARLTMRHFFDDFLENYLEATGEAAMSSVGGYQLEKLGIHLFERVEGDHFTILGLPLIPLLNWFRAEGLLRT
jgi:septum formation protein